MLQTTQPESARHFDRSSWGELDELLGIVATAPALYADVSAQTDFVSSLRLSALAVVVTTMLSCANGEAPVVGQSTASAHAGNVSQIEGNGTGQVTARDVGSTATDTSEVTEECVAALPDVGRVLKRTGAHRYELDRWAMEVYLERGLHCNPWPTRTVWSRKSGDAMTIDAAPGTLWRAIGLRTGDELVAVGPMVISANPEIMLNGYHQLIRGPLESVVFETKRKAWNLPKITIDIVGSKLPKQKD